MARVHCTRTGLLRQNLGLETVFDREQGLAVPVPGAPIASSRSVTSPSPRPSARRACETVITPSAGAVAMRNPHILSLISAALVVGCATEAPQEDGLSKSLVQDVVAGALVARSDIDPTPLTLDCDEPAVTCSLTASLDDNAGVAALLDALDSTGAAVTPAVGVYLVDLVTTDDGSKEARVWFELRAPVAAEPAGTAGESHEVLAPVGQEEVGAVLEQARADLPAGVDDVFDVACWDEAGCRIRTTQASNDAIASLLERLEGACQLGPGCEAWLKSIQATPDGRREAEILLTVVQ